MKIYKITIILATSAILTGCSVFMAANKKGVPIEKLSACQTRGCLLSLGATPVGEKSKSGAEYFQAKKPTGSAARATMHGVLDVATLGIWEVAGTPMEAVMKDEDMYAFKITYKNDGEEIKTFQLMR